MRAVLVANEADADPGLVGRALRARGYSFTEFLREDHEQWPSLDGFDLIVAMGSNWSTYWEDVSAPVLAEQRLLTDAIARGLPVLGVCFGAQQLAIVLGGEVSRAQTHEIGWHQVFPVTEAAAMAPPSMTEGPWMQWHYDCFSVPSGATVLADSPVGPQAMVCGRTLALQFHPEATESIVRLWMNAEGMAELDKVGLDHVTITDETRAHLAEAERRCDDLVDWFLSNVAQSH
jgi:GMP synthase-like glutamine amidotransferase